MTCFGFPLQHAERRSNSSDQYSHDEKATLEQVRHLTLALDVERDCNAKMEHSVRGLEWEQQVFLSVCLSLCVYYHVHCCCTKPQQITENGHL